MTNTTHLSEISEISESDAKTLLKELELKLQRYNHAYYMEDQSLISDAEYDQLFQINQYLERKFPHLILSNSPSAKVGSKVQSTFDKIQHLTPMLSLNNGFNVADIEHFIEKVQKFLNIDSFPEVFCEPKIDGMSFSAIFIHGKLSSVSTRGDGTIGEDITHNALTLNFPNTIPVDFEILEVRGEIFMQKSDFQKLQHEMDNLGKQRFSNPRNAAAGSVRQLDPTITQSRNLKYFVYSIGEMSVKFVNSQEQMLQKLQQLGFCTNPIGQIAHSIDDIINFYEHILSIRESMDYEIDGLVYKINSLPLQERLSFVGRNPRFAIAHKFPAIIGTTKLLSIDIQVGRTGVLTPVANLEPISIAGVVISRASLHNYHELSSKDIRVGDIVYLQRAGDVIPQITGVDMSRRNNNLQKFIFPNQCPSCKSILSYDNTDKVIRCENIHNCDAQIYERICHFASKDALNIEGLGKKNIKYLIDAKLISNPVDIFSLSQNSLQNPSSLTKMHGFGDKSITNLLQSIDNAKKVPLYKFIYSLGIRSIGQANAKLLAHLFQDVENFIEKMQLLISGNQAIYNSIKSIYGMSEKTIWNICQFFRLKHNLEIVQKLSKILTIQQESVISKDSILSNKKIVFTGKLQKLSRMEAKTQAEQLGAQVTNSVSSTTDFVICGDSPGLKLTQAQALGITILTEDEWIELTTSTNL